ncbi:FAD-dependent oxidoreductase [Paraburkholderia bonniea]|uniref:FAD-dependent oxidoreductase n=1 Tax=Paraburkholderia bonniea TaxID=2152891 RepID=UPI0012921656|nr:FAD-dependent oxidoreductase [Paraburkholderia bonniea]
MPVCPDSSSVLVVGAGPAGLAIALSLARARIPVRLIDKRLAPATHSRAIGIQARTLELLEQHRVVEPFLELGHRAHAVNLYSHTHRLARLDFEPLHTRYPYLLFLDQTVTERLLSEHLATLGVEIERGVELIEFTHGSAGLSATLQRADGHRETLRPDYLVAADGAHSTVRHRLGLGFAGKTFEQTFLLADVQGQTEWPDDELHLFASSAGLTGLFPLGAGRYRMIADLPGVPAQETSAPGAEASALSMSPLASLASSTSSASPTPLAPDAAPSFEVCRAIVEQRVGFPVHLTQMLWSSYFRVNSRMVEQMRSGRVFLVGDAAHVHSPAGAQGMNTGIQEAFNLGWKLARVLSAGAPDALLDTFHAERHPVAAKVLRQSSVMTQMAQADHGPLKLLREHVMPLLASFGPLRDAARAMVSELAVRYRHSPLTLERMLDGGARAGERAPDANVHVLDGPLGVAPGSARLYELHDPAWFSLWLLVEPTPQVSLEGDASLAVLDPALKWLVAGLEPWLSGALRVWCVTDAPEPGMPSLTEAYGQTRPAFYLVRPDGYICARGRPGPDLEAVLRHSETWFTAASVAAVASAATDER